MEQIEFIWQVGTSGRFEDARLVRRTVFCEEQGYSLIGEFDDIDAESWHVIGYMGGQPAATARMFSEGGEIYHIGRVAVLPQYRGIGAGQQMMQALIEKAKAERIKALVLNAQADKYVFYEKCGFVLTGKKMLDEGQPHVEMMCELP